MCNSPFSGKNGTLSVKIGQRNARRHSAVLKLKKRNSLIYDWSEAAAI